MKKSIVLMILLVISNISFSQEAVYSNPKPSELRIINSSNNNFPFFGNPDQLVSSFGQPVSITNAEADMLEYGSCKDYNYDGLKLRFEDRPNGEMCISFKITNSNYSVRYNNKSFKIGDQVSAIENIFPESFNQMQSSGQSYIRVEYNEINDIVETPYYSPLIIEFDPNTNLINYITVSIM